MSTDALVCEEGNLVFNPSGDGKPKEKVEDRNNMFMFAHSHQDPSCRDFGCTGASC